MHKANKQIAGYLKLSAAYEYTNANDKDALQLILELRHEIVHEMHLDVYLQALEIEKLMFRI